MAKIFCVSIFKILCFSSGKNVNEIFMAIALNLWITLRNVVISGVSILSMQKHVRFLNLKY